MHRYVWETDRLILRPLVVNDAEAAFVWLSDPQVNRFMPYTLYTEVEPARQWIASLDGLVDNYIFGIERREDGLLIGTVSVRLGAIEPGAWSLGYNLRRDCWRQGYATEAAKGVLDFAYHTLGARDFTAEHAVANPASGSVLGHCGFVYDRDITYSKHDGSETFPAKFYKLHLE